MLLSASLYIGN